MSTNQRLLWFALLATVAWALVMALEAGEYKKEACNTSWSPASWMCLADSPIANLELAQTPESFRREIDCDSIKENCLSPTRGSDGNPAREPPMEYRNRSGEYLHGLSVHRSLLVDLRFAGARAGRKTVLGGMYCDIDCRPV